MPASGDMMWADEDQRAWCAQVGRLQERQGRSEAGGDLRDLR